MWSKWTECGLCSFYSCCDFMQWQKWMSAQSRWNHSVVSYPWVSYIHFMFWGIFGGVVSFFCVFFCVFFGLLRQCFSVAFGGCFGSSWYTPGWLRSHRELPDRWEGYVGADKREAGQRLLLRWILFTLWNCTFFLTEVGGLEYLIWGIWTRISGMYGLGETGTTQKRLKGMHNYAMNWGRIWRLSLNLVSVPTWKNTKHTCCIGPSRGKTVCGCAVWRWRFVTLQSRLSRRSWTFSHQIISRNWSYTQARCSPSFVTSHLILAVWQDFTNWM